MRQVSKILSNLISNALKYTPEEGHIAVSLTLADTLPEKLTAAASSHYLVVSVTDDGTGMSQEDVERIFERYKRLTAGEHVAAGSGIGLHYVKQLLLIHKGSIVAEVRPEGGMRFTFAIPVDESLYDIGGEPTVEVEFIDGMATAVADDSVSDAEEDTGGGSAAEDGHRRGQSAAAALLPPIIAPRFEVFTADNGSDGFDLIHTEMPDVVVTDVLMSKMDGYELCRKIKTDVLLSHIR
ncbi:MAG: hybrid sensor histidine kinase/response regulator [Alistipes senegalensis]